MTRDQYVQVCKSCNNRGFDPKKGVICSLTKEHANYEGICSDYNLDEKAEISGARSVPASQALEGGGENESKGQSDMFWGAVWCVGGIIATASDVGYIFWGAIIFGGIQFIKGVVAASK